MGATLAEGIGRLADWSGVLVALADMPWVRASSFTTVARELARDGICVPRYQGRQGHPVGFARQFFPELAALEGDQGARELLQRHAGQVTFLELDDPGILQDIDRQEDLP
jgi:molybdenum cofactor cytidylyltransferase